MEDVIYGKNAVTEALEAGTREINKIWIANNIHTVDGGTHEEGFKRALTRVMNDYARKYNLLKENDKTPLALE